MDATLTPHPLRILSEVFRPCVRVSRGIKGGKRKREEKKKRERKSERETMNTGSRVTFFPLSLDEIHLSLYQIE